MKNVIFPALIIIMVATGCSSLTGVAAPSPTPTEFACAENGAVQAMDVDSQTHIFVYLPPCYDTDSSRSYPVLYLFPGYGGSNSDFFGPGTNRIADELILSGEIPPFLIAGMDDPFPDLDARIFTEKILPFMEARFRIRADRRYHAAAGGSFGGAVAYHLAFKRYDLVSSAGIFGNGAAVGEEESIRAWLAAIPAEQRPRVFINVGESDTYMLERAKVLIPMLDEAGIQHLDIFSPGKHSGDYWVSNFPAYFRWLSVDWE